MLKQNITIDSIPTIIWGEASNKAYLFIHGKLSQKEEAEEFAISAEKKGFQVISFDLPEHGERKAADYLCTVQNAVHDLQVISDFVTKKWEAISIFGNSVGAYFSLVAYQNLRLDKCLFLSPILDMEKLIQGMMKWSNVTEEELKEKQEILTSQGEKLSWPYYSFVKEHPIEKWNPPTFILYGSNDTLTPRNIVDAFVERFHCHLEVLQNGDHYFHTQEQKEVVEKWLNVNLC